MAAFRTDTRRLHTREPQSRHILPTTIQVSLTTWRTVMHRTLGRMVACIIVPEEGSQTSGMFSTGKVRTAHCDSYNVQHNSRGTHRCDRFSQIVVWRKYDTRSPLLILGHSANGAKFRAYTNGTDFHWYGTSLAAPLWASVITLINEERTAVGKGPVGFINRVLYESE